MKKLIIFAILLMILSACGSSHTVEITFETNGGFPQFSQASVNSNSPQWVPPKPSLLNSILVNWYVDSEFTEVYRHTHLLEHKTLTLYAKYVLYDQDLEFVIEFNAVGGTFIPNQLVLKNGLISEPEAPLKDGYDFLFWEYVIGAQTGQVDFSLPVTQHMVLEAVYRIKGESKA